MFPLELYPGSLSAWLQHQAIERAAERLGAARADIPGLWNVPGHPELTITQMLQLAAEQ